MPKNKNVQKMSILNNAREVIIFLSFPDHDGALAVRAEGGDEPSLQRVPDLVRQVEQSSL